MPKHIPLFHIDSFTTQVFSGNPAAVMLFDHWPSDAVLQKLATENGLAATAFVLPADDNDQFALRWFTPTAELPLCAHGTIAAAWVMREGLSQTSDKFTFTTGAGDLPVERVAPGRYRMDFPVDPYIETSLDQSVCDALGKMPSAMLRARYSVAVYETEAEVRSITPDIAAINQCRHAQRPGAVVITAPADSSKDYDFVSRFFAPGVGIDEDPVTGSAHCILAKYWADRLGCSKTLGYQASARGGHIACEVSGDRVFFTGDAVCYSRGDVSAEF